MSIFSAIAKAEHTFVAWAEKEWSKLQTEAPKIEAIADAGFKYATVGLSIIQKQVGPDTEAGKVIAEAIKDISTVSAVVYDVGAHPMLGSILNDVVSNLSGLLSASHISNAGTVGSITKIISTLAAVAEAFGVIAA